MQRGTLQAMDIKITPEGAEGKIIWQSDNQNVLAVTEEGTVLAVGNGKANIIAKTLDGSVQGSFEITVYTPATGIVLSKQQATIFVGDTLQLVGNVLPEDASNKEITWESENENIALINQDGLVTAVSEGSTNITASIGTLQAKCQITVIKQDTSWQIEFDESLQVTGDEISKLPWEDTSVENIRRLITTNLEMSFDTSNVGTGTNLVLTDTAGNEVFRYQFILYGDVNGDGLINSLDVLVLQKYILESRTLEGIFLKAGNISKNGANPSSLDVLKLQKHILETKFIEQ